MEGLLDFHQQSFAGGVLSFLRSRNVLYLLIYECINGMFILKYMSPSSPWLTFFLYLVGVNTYIAILIGFRHVSLGRRLRGPVFYFAATFMLALLLALIMKRFDPAVIQVGRAPAIEEWLSRLLSGQYPYGAPVHPSGFPFLFVLALPFYWLGDVGYLQIFSFMVFAFLVYRWSGDSKNRLFRLSLLILSPVFLYEVVVRSDLFSNMVILILFLMMFYTIVRKPSIKLGWIFLLGCVGGLLLSTRGIVFTIFIVFLGTVFKKHLKRAAVFSVGGMAVFAATLAPFMVWNISTFMNHGPFAIQSAYLPLWLLILCMVTCAVCARKLSSIQAAISAVALILFGLVLVPFVQAVFAKGWRSIVFEDGFDIAYFSFTLPFLILSIHFPGSTRDLSDTFSLSKSDTAVQASDCS